MKIILFLLWLVIGINAYSQRIIFNKLSNEQLPIQSNINTIFQDKHGFIWLGSDNGLVKFNGYNSIFYSTTNSNLSCNRINKITEDRQGNIWVGTDKGLNIFDRTKNEFRAFRTTDHGLQSDKINDLLIDTRGVLWVATSKGLSVFDKSGTAITLTHSTANINSLSSDEVTSVCESADSSIFIGTLNGGLNNFNWKSGKVIRFKQTEIKLSDTLEAAPILAMGDISTLLFRKGNLYIGGTAGLFKLNVTNYHAQKLKFDSSASVNSIFPDSLGNIWLGSSRGLFKFDGTKSTYFPELLPHSNATDVLAVFVDKQGTLLIGTRGYCFYATSGETSIVDLKIPQADSTLKINTLFETKNKKLLLGTNKGYCYVNKSLGGIDNVTHGNLSDNNFKKKNFITAFAQISDDTILIGTAYGLAKTALSTEQQNFIFLNGYDSSAMFITSILGDSNSFYVSTLGKGVLKYNNRTNLLEKIYSKKSKDSNSINSDSVFFLASTTNNLWIATSNSVQKIVNDKSFHTYKFNEKITGLCGLQGNIFVSTTTSLLIYSDKTDSFEQLNIPASTILSMFVGNDRLFISTSNGAIEYDYKNDKTNLDQSLIGNIFCQLKDRSKILCGFQGNVSLITSNNKLPNSTHNIIITSFKIGTTERYKELYNGDTINLNYDENSFSVEFTSLDYSGNKSIYQYVLQGFEQKSSQLNDQRNFTYTNIDPGSYKLLITQQSSNYADSKQVKNSAKPTDFILHINIKAPFWKEWWFVSGVILALFAIGLLAYYLRLKNIQQKKAEAESRALQSELQALRLQMNPHFIFNSLNSIQSFITENRQELASEYLALFARLMRMILDNSSKVTIPIAKELETLEIYLTLERVRFDNSFDYKFVIDPSVDIHWHTIPPMLIQPYIENSIKHGLRPKTSGGIIKIIMNMKDENNLLCSIEDNGIGREKALELKSKRLTSHKSVAMEATKDRLDILNSLRKQKVSVKIIDLYQKEIATGTRVELVIPLEDDNEEE